MKNKKLFKLFLLWLPFLAVTCFSFPFYNFTKDVGKSIVVTNLILNTLCYYELGKQEKLMLKEWKIGKIALLNLSAILLGMVLRFFLEFGEVSNTYNFILPNIVLHLFMSVVVTEIGRSNSTEKDLKR